MNLLTSSIIRPYLFNRFPDISAGQSTRHGGVSKPPYDTLNLGKSTDDDPADVAENRRRYCAALGFTPEKMAWSKQVHGDQIRIVETPGGSEGYDALITNVPGILLVVSVADCASILVYDHANRALAAIHAGWKGTAAQIVAKTLTLMADTYGTRGADCYAYLGACIDECSFEVGPEVAEQFSEPFKRWDAARGKFMVDLKKANAAQLLDFGVPQTQIEISPYCTLLNPQDFFSHRHSGGITGRGMSGIGLLTQ
jgi:YfiH family protein